jgi:tRNA pseudouridine synthase 10
MMDKLNVRKKATKILKEKYVCNRCLGRQFAQLLSGFSNEQRGKILRTYLAMLIDAGEKIDVHNSNFYGIKFHLKKIKSKKPKKCSICSDLFLELKKKVKPIIRKLKKYEHDTFLVGSKPTSKLLRKEQNLWDKVGIEWCETIKSEINRFLGIEIEKITGKVMNRKMPDITVLVDLESDEIELNVRSVFVYAKYKKLSRKMPQTKWKRRVYPTSVHDIVEKPFLKQTKAEYTKFHGAGREDVNVRCLGWRPFVIEMVNPKKRTLDIKKIKKQVNKSSKAKIKDLKIADKKTVKRIKFSTYDKTYRAIVEFEEPIKDLDKINELNDLIIAQKTPTRVLSRRTDKRRKRKVKNIKFKLLNKNKIQLEIKAQSGLYIKELIHGDEGRTEPSVSGLIDNKVKNIELDVIKIHCD